MWKSCNSSQRLIVHTGGNIVVVWLRTWLRLAKLRDLFARRFRSHSSADVRRQPAAAGAATKRHFIKATMSVIVIGERAGASFVATDRPARLTLPLPAPHLRLGAPRASTAVGRTLSLLYYTFIVLLSASSLLHSKEIFANHWCCGLCLLCSCLVSSRAAVTFTLAVFSMKTLPLLAY